MWCIAYLYRRGLDKRTEKQQQKIKYKQFLLHVFEGKDSMMPSMDI